MRCSERPRAVMTAAPRLLGRPFAISRHGGIGALGAVACAL